jgi:hypothetical protein
MKHSEVLSRYVNTGIRIPEEQYDRLSPSLKKSYIRIRGVAGYESWEFKVLSDDDKIKFIEKKGKYLTDGNDLKYLYQFSKNKDYYITKVIHIKGERLYSDDIELLLLYSDNKDDIISKIIESKGDDLNEGDVDDLLKYSDNKDKFNRIITQVINIGGGISKELYNVLSPLLKKSFLRIRGLSSYGYDGWEFEFLTDDEIIKYIETKGKNLYNQDIKYILKYSSNEISVINKILKIETKYDFEDIIYYLLHYSKDKELVKKILLQNNIDYKLINNIILNNFSDIPLIPDNYKETLQEIKRIKQIML